MANYSAPSTEAHLHSLPSGLHPDSAEISSSTPRRSLDPRRPRPDTFLLSLRHASRHVLLCRHHCLVLWLLCRRRGNYMYLTCSPCGWSLSKATPFLRYEIADRSSFAAGDSCRGVDSGHCLCSIRGSVRVLDSRRCISEAPSWMETPSAASHHRGTFRGKP